MSSFSGNITKKYYSKNFLDTNSQWSSNIFILINVHCSGLSLFQTKIIKNREDYLWNANSLRCRRVMHCTERDTTCSSNSTSHQANKDRELIGWPLMLDRHTAPPCSISSRFLFPLLRSAANNHPNDHTRLNRTRRAPWLSPRH